jgi:hypothetical protein
MLLDAEPLWRRRFGVIQNRLMLMSEEKIAISVTLLLLRHMMVIDMQKEKQMLIDFSSVCRKKNQNNVFVWIHVVHY